MGSITINLGIVLTVVLWYLAICAICSVLYGVYESLKNDLYNQYGESRFKWWTKVCAISLLQAPFFPVFVATEITDSIRVKRQQKIHEQATL